MHIDAADAALCISDDVAEPAASATALHADVALPAATPIVQTSLFSFPTFEALLDGLAAEHRSHVYTRGQNPTVEVLEHKLARLERGEACKCFASGMAAISAVMLGLLEAGDHILFANHVYGPTLQLASHLRRFGIEHDHVLHTEPERIAAALRPNTRLLWLESPGTLMLRLLDIEAVAAFARERGVLTCIDNSYATPLLQKPITHGVDIVVHTCSKYIGGHSDVMAGAVITTAERIEQIFYRAFLLNGGVLAPWDAWLLLRGLRTLHVRLRQQSADALRIAEFLREHPAVRAVHHPAWDPGAERLRHQLRGTTGLVSFVLRDDAFATVARVIDALRHFRIAVSWGGVESIVISPNRRTNLAHLAAQQIPPGLIRLSVGLEGADLLIDDLAAALEHAP